MRGDLHRFPELGRKLSSDLFSLKLNLTPSHRLEVQCMEIVLTMIARIKPAQHHLSKLFLTPRSTKAFFGNDSQ